MVQGIWSRNGTELMDGNENGRIMINNPTLAASPYQITLRFNPLIISDVGVYECDAIIIPQDTIFVSTATTSNSRIITIADFPTQFVDVTAEGISTAGFSGYTLTCNTSREPNLPPTSSLAVQWLDPGGNIITNGDNFTISGAGPTSNVVLISRLVFNNLYTSQAGEYTCRTLETIPGIVINHPQSVTFPIQVKLPSPITPLTFRRSRNSTLSAGTSFTLTCVIISNTSGVDTEFRIKSSIVGNGTLGTNRVRVSQPMSVGENTFETTMVFSHLLEADSGVYSCSAYITSLPSQPNVITSDSAFGSESINVAPLQAPIVTISRIQILAAGDQHTLTCTAIVDEFLIAAPILEWRLLEDAAGVSIGTQSTIGSTIIELTFSSIRTSQAGVYKCRTTINVTDIEPLSQTANQTIQVQIPPPSVLVLDSLALPYNGTVFTVTGVVELDQSVDTAVTASGLWSNNGVVFQATTSPPYPTNLTFRPLATNSSGVYILKVSVRPSDNSPYIVGNNGTTNYSLVVRPLPSRPPAIAIVSRQELDECKEVMTLNCTANQVESLFSPPTIVWIAPDGREISTVEGNNRRMDPQTGYLIFSDVTTNNRGLYTCRTVVNIPEAQIDNHYDEATVQVNTNAVYLVPGVVGNLVCTTSSSPYELSFSWEPPTLLGSEVVSYQVLVNRLEQRPGTRDVVQSSVYEQFVGMEAASVTGLVAEVPYNVTVKALNLAGCGEVLLHTGRRYKWRDSSETMWIYHNIVLPVPPPPENVVVQRFDSTSIGVSWTKLTLVELKGLANYIVTYDIIIGSRKRQSQLGGTITVPWIQNQIIISGLQPGAEYDISVRTSTAAGVSDPVSPGDRALTTTQLPPTVASSDSDNMVAIIGGVVAVVIVLIIAATIAVIVIVIVIAVILRSRRAEFSPNQKPLPYEASGSMMLTDISPTNRENEVHTTIEADHEYEMLIKYNKAYEETKVPPPMPKLEAEAVQQSLSSTGDYKFTQCPAYIPVATTNSHKTTDTPLVQSTTAEDDYY